MKKLIAASIFLLAAFLGAMAVGGGFGEIGPILLLLIIIVSYAFMHFAVSMWKDAKKDKKK
jgi:uncharacterized membrane protein